MISKRIAGANAYPGAPKGWKPDRDGECGHLAIRVTRDGDRVVHCESAWEPTPKELELLNAGGQVVLRVCTWQVPVALYVEPAPPDQPVRKLVEIPDGWLLVPGEALIPEGWVLVPKEPTDQMIQRGLDERVFGVARIWGGMLAAAPKPGG